MPDLGLSEDVFAGPDVSGAADLRAAMQEAQEAAETDVEPVAEAEAAEAEPAEEPVAEAEDGGGRAGRGAGGRGRRGR